LQCGQKWQDEWYDSNAVRSKEVRRLESKWDIKVTSKGQITLPKQVRDALMIREGDYLQAAVEENKIVLTMKKPEANYGERMKIWADRALMDMGYPTEESRSTLDPRVVRDKISAALPDLTKMVREEREKR